MIVYCFPQGTVVSRVSVYHFVSYNAGYNKSITAHLGSLGKKDPCEESDMTERLHFHFSLSRIGEGKGNPLQCSCLENPRDGGAWWAAVYGVTQSQTRLKRLSSSSMYGGCFMFTTFFCFSFNQVPTWGLKGSSEWMATGVMKLNPEVGPNL